MPAALTFVRTPDEAATCGTLVLLGRAALLKRADVLDLLPSGVSAAVWTEMVDQGDPGDHGRTTQTFTGRAPTRRLVAGVLPEVCSRHNSPSRAWAIPSLVAAAGRRGSVGIICVLEHGDHAYASALAVARAHPTYTLSRPRGERKVRVCLLGPSGPIAPTPAITEGAAAVRFAAELVDRPPDRLGPDALVDEALRVAGRHATVQPYIVRGARLAELGLGAIAGVGRASRQEPALVVLDHDPGGAPPRVSWVGKGITFDTGGLSIKSKTGMPGMKTDMGGAAAVLAAFDAAAAQNVGLRLTAVLCVAENAVGASAIRPDDVLDCYSGRTVEVNNTDAEGRLVLADGVAWACRNRDPALLVDVATLTGAQSMATGKRHAAVISSDEALEAAAVLAGRASGDLVHPLPYCPEFFRREFTSQVADMKNSVKDRQNGQSSCAAQFLGNHLDAVSYERPWLHVDMAGPVSRAGRATGYGPALLLTLVGLGPPVAPLEL